MQFEAINILKTLRPKHIRSSLVKDFIMFSIILKYIYIQESNMASKRYSNVQMLNI